jgi:hypothetical protein
MINCLRLFLDNYRHPSYDGKRDRVGINDGPPPPLLTPPVFVSPSQMTDVRPLFSFPKFMQTQRSDLPLDGYNKLYLDYQYHYVEELADKFFEANMREEWFRDRYDPSRILEREQRAIEWAALESEIIRSALIENPTQVLETVSLEPPSASSSSLKQSSDHAVDKHFPGHANRAIYLSGIPDCCTKSQLKNAILLAFSNPELNRYDNADSIASPTPTESSAEATDAAKAILAAERIVISSPQWSSKHPPLHERSAWVIMQSSDQVAQAVKTLKHLIVQIRGNESINEDMPDILYEFTLNASVHTPRPGPSLPLYLSDSRRIAADTKKAMELCDLLDEERRVPDVSRLSSIIDATVQPTIHQALMKSPTSSLDLAIAYLRRVHCVSFYGARKFRDESHMLSYAPAVLHRSVPYLAHPEDSGDNARSMVTAGSSSIPGDMSDTKASEHDNVDQTDAEAVAVANTAEDDRDDVDEAVDDHENDDEDQGERYDEANDGGDTKDAAAAKPSDHHNDSMTSESSPDKLRTSRSNQRYLPLSDKRIEALIADLNIKKQKREAGVLTKDEQDAQYILSLQEKAFEEAVKSAAIVEGEKARCCYVGCKKLFKNLDFLSKHLRTKHESFDHEEMVRIAEPYMKSKYNAEDLTSKPLPPIRKDSEDGIILKSVREVLEGLQSNRSGSYQNRFFSHRGGGGQNYRGGGRGYRDMPGRGMYDRSMSAGPYKRYREDDRRRSFDSNAPETNPLKRANPGDDTPKPAGNFPAAQPAIFRPKSSYVDLDAPKVGFSLLIMLAPIHNQVRVSDSSPCQTLVTFVG